MLLQVTLNLLKTINANASLAKAKLASTFFAEAEVANAKLASAEFATTI